MKNEVVTIREVVENRTLAEKTANCLVAEGKIPGFKVEASWRFRITETVRWIPAQEAGSSMGRAE